MKGLFGMNINVSVLILVREETGVPGENPRSTGEINENSLTWNTLTRHGFSGDRHNTCQLFGTLLFVKLVQFFFSMQSVLSRSKLDWTKVCYKRKRPLYPTWNLNCKRGLEKSVVLNLTITMALNNWIHVHLKKNIIKVCYNFFFVNLFKCKRLEN